MSCRNRRDSIIELVEDTVQNTVMPSVMAYLADSMNEFRQAVESEYFAAIVKFKHDHLSIRVNNSVDINQLRRIKIKNQDGTVTLETRSITIDVPDLSLRSNQTLMPRSPAIDHLARLVGDEASD